MVSGSERILKPDDTVALRQVVGAFKEVVADGIPMAWATGMTGIVVS
jgi:hypothetical protein